MRLRTLTVSLVSLAALVYGASPANADTSGSDINIRQLAVQPSTTQAGGNPNVELFFRFCSPGLEITAVTGTGTGAQVTTSEPNNVIAGPYTVVRIAGTGGTSGLPYVDGTWHATPINANTFQLGSQSKPPAGDLKFSPGPRAQVMAPPDTKFGCLGADRTNEIQKVTIQGGPTGGTFTLTFGSQTTTPLAHDATAAQMQAALEKLSSIGTGNVKVTLEQTGFGPQYTVEFIGDLALQPEPLMTADASGLTGGFPSIDVSETARGSALEELGARVRDFQLHLPPGFLGSPTALPACPEPLWLVNSCPDTTILGHSLTLTAPDFSGSTTESVDVATPLYNLQTLGLAPASLGTQRLLSTPGGPFAIGISLRAANGNYGIDSALNNIPTNAGGPSAVIVQIYTVLCAQVPCKATDQQDPATVAPLPNSPVPIRPFFRNPSSCGVKQVSLDAISWKTTARPAPTAHTSFTTTGCNAVPFPPELSIEPTDPNDQTSHDAGNAVAQTVAIDYGHDYADDAIWPSALRDADVRLPKGITLSPGGGEGLEACSFDQFGVNSAGKQVNTDEPACPAGSRIGGLSVETPVLPGPLDGDVFFGPVSAPGPPSIAGGNPWKLFLYIHGFGLRLKLVGNVEVDPNTGQIHNVFLTQPETPFRRLELHLNGRPRAILANPEDCDPHTGDVLLAGWSGATHPSHPSITSTNCQDSKPFAPQIDSAGSNPEQAGASTTSSIVMSRGDGQDDIKTIQLSLPVGAVGSLAAAPECPLSLAQAGNCPDASKVGTVKTTVGTGGTNPDLSDCSCLTATGSLYLAEPQGPNDAASLALVVPARAGPIDLGQVVVMNAVRLRASDTGVDTFTSDVPNFFKGVWLHVRKIEISVDKPGFFYNPTGCDSRPLTATFTGYGGETSTTTRMLNAKGCENLPFGPKLRLIAGAKGQNGQLQHPPLTAIVTQGPAEADIKNSQVILPDLIRPNAVQFNAPGGLCTDTQFAQNACPGPSLVGSASVTTPVLPFQLSGPVYVVQEVGSVLPKLYVVLRGRGIQVVLRARNSFLHAIQTINTFDNLPDVPQAHFELKIKGGPGGILNNFYDACGVAKKHRKFDYTFTGHNGKRVKKSAYLQQEGCVSSKSLASIATRTLKVNRKGVGMLKVRCRVSRRCKGSVSIKAKGVSAKKKFSISAKKAKAMAVKFSKAEVRKIFKKKRIKTRAKLKVGGKTISRSITIVPKR
jgi:hypothetical protein